MDTEKPIDQSIQKEVEKKQKPVFYFEEPEYLEKNPIISRETITVGDHEIELINQNPNVQLDQEHLRQAQEVLERIYAIAPELVKNYEKIFIVHDPNVDKKEGETTYMPNAQNIQDVELKKQGVNFYNGICINQRGYRTDLPHRIKEINNFKGTTTHEIFHSIEWVDKYKYKKDISEGILKRFMDELGYLDITQSNEWKEIRTGRYLDGYLHKKSDYFTKTGNVPTDLESLPTKYARLNPRDDLCDSFVAYLFAPEKLDPKRKEFFEKYFPLKTSKENGK